MSLATAVLLFQAAGTAPAPPATEPTAPAQAAATTRAAYPFAVGETLRYAARFGNVKLGQATLEVVRLDTLRGEETFVFRFRIWGGNMLYSMDDALESWTTTDDFTSLRYLQNYGDDKRDRDRTYDIFPERGFYRQSGLDTTFATPRKPIDDTAFFYLLRFIRLQPGKAYRIDRYFKQDKNPIVVAVPKREKMKLPDGSEVDCLVLHPVVDTRGIFSKRSNARLWLTDDARRIPVQIRVHFPFGAVTLTLEEMVVPPTTAPATAPAARAAG